LGTSKDHISSAAGKPYKQGSYAGDLDRPSSAIATLFLCTVLLSHL